MKLEHAVEQAVGHGTFVLVFSANADRLQALMKPLAAPCPVVLVDFRDHIPDKLVEELEVPLRIDQLVHVAVGSRLDLRLLRALWHIRDQRKTFKGTVVLSTSANLPGELPFKDAYERADIFPVVVGGGDHTARWIPPRFRQAIVLVHGIGEQRPGRPLRSFADAVLTETTWGDGKKYHSEYDEVSFDYRKLSANFKEETQNHLGLNASILTPRETEFFEYYFSIHVQGRQPTQIRRGAVLGLGPSLA